MSAKSETTSIKILIVDDNRDAATTLAMLVEGWGHEARVCFNGYSAIDIAYDFKPDLILLDIRLPDISGYEVARRLREEDIFRKTKICAVTAYPEHQDFASLEQAGFNFLILKPAKPEILKSVISEV